MIYSTSSVPYVAFMTLLEQVINQAVPFILAIVIVGVAVAFIKRV